MAATVTVNNYGRSASLGGMAAISITIAAASVSYAKTSGGLAIDLASALVTAGPFDANPHPSDVVGFLPLGLSTNGFIPTGLTVGTATYTTQSGASTQNNNLGALSTCPAYIRLVGSGSASYVTLTEVADGVNTDSFTGLLIVARGGHNK